MITYLILTHGEKETFKLIDFIQRHKDAEDEIVILNDPTTADYENQLCAKEVTVINHKLDYSYSEHRNYGLKHCKGEYVFALDADETPTIELIANIKEILASTKADLVWIPRLNVFEGLTQADAIKYGWKVNNGSIVNWPDSQTRLFRNNGSWKWEGNLHERVKGKGQEIHLKPDTRLCLVHRKDIAKQRADNEGYNAKYSAKENQGL